MNYGEILDQHGTAEERHHEIVKVRVHDGTPGDTEGEVWGGEGAVLPPVHHIRAAVYVGKVTKPMMVWESQIEHELERDSGVSAEIDKDFHIRRDGDFKMNQYPPNITRVYLFEV